MVGRSQSIVVLNGESEQIVLVGSVRVRACCLRGGGGGFRADINIPVLEGSSEGVSGV